MISLVVDRQGVKRHQGKVGVLCGVSLVGVYQGYASHVFECPGDILQFWFSHTICGNSSFMLLLVKINLFLTDTSVYSVTGRKRFVALSPDQIKKISRCSIVSFLRLFFFYSGPPLKAFLRSWDQVLCLPATIFIKGFNT